MNMQFWYESAREVVDGLIDTHFEDLRPEGHRQLARIWQYLRDQEIKEILAAMRKKPCAESTYSYSSDRLTSMGAAD